LGIHHYAVNTHPDEFVPEPPPKNILDPPMHQGIFPKFFQGGPKVVKFVFSRSKLRKQPLFAENFKIQG